MKVKGFQSFIEGMNKNFVTDEVFHYQPNCMRDKCLPTFGYRIIVEVSPQAENMAMLKMYVSPTIAYCRKNVVEYCEKMAKYIDINLACAMYGMSVPIEGEYKYCKMEEIPSELEQVLNRINSSAFNDLVDRQCCFAERTPFEYGGEVVDNNYYLFKQILG